MLVNLHLVTDLTLPVSMPIFSDIGGYRGVVCRIGLFNVPDVHQSAMGEKDGRGHVLASYGLRFVVGVSWMTA